MPKRSYYNPPPGEIPKEAPRDIVKIEFAKRLYKAMAEKGWTQSELARRAEPHMKGKRLGRDNVSTYIRGNSLPGPAQLRALAKALGCKPSDLLPHRGVPSVVEKAPPLEMRENTDGSVWLRVNQAVSMEQAMKVLAILKHDDDDNTSAAR